jgi:hypothetical protein
MDEVETPIASVDHEPEPKTPIATRGRPIASPARIMKRPAAKAPTASATVKKAAKKAPTPTTPQATKATVATPKAPVKATQPKALAKAASTASTTVKKAAKKSASAPKAADIAPTVDKTAKAKAMTRQQRLQDILVEAEDEAPLVLLQKVQETPAGDGTDGSG